MRKLSLSTNKQKYNQSSEYRRQIKPGKPVAWWQQKSRCLENPGFWLWLWCFVWFFFSFFFFLPSVKYLTSSCLVNPAGKLGKESRSLSETQIAHLIWSLLGKGFYKNCGDIRCSFFNASSHSIARLRAREGRLTTKKHREAIFKQAVWSAVGTTSKSLPSF